uniref:DUF4340 domain-containing protein n=1 Tax=uncultured nuHF2 cluster bacterium HF0500_31B05 TaxID=723589 RepID=E7C5W8_9BACT|nr:hypothetical protein [uncultured nuHF2 cluster bacterium HF0500_31B05]
MLGLLLVIDLILDRNAASQRNLAATVRPVVGVDPQRAQTLRIAQGGSRWEYVLRDSMWRYPAYFDAYVQRPRLDQFLRSVMSSSGSIIDDDEHTAQGFGFGDAGALEVEILDAQRRDIVAARVGRGIPGALGSESYLRKMAENTVFHLHANPRLALDAQAVPMIDRHLLPQALHRGAIVRVSFPGRTAEVESMWREDLPPDLTGPPLRGPTYRWRARLAGMDTTCVDHSVYAYLSYLTRVRYDRLLAPGNLGRTAERIGVVLLEDDKGVIDTLEVAGGDPAVVRHRLARLTATLTSEQAGLMFPVAAAVLDTLAQPSIYERAAPRTQGVF